MHVVSVITYGTVQWLFFLRCVTRRKRKSEKTRKRPTYAETQMRACTYSWGGTVILPRVIPIASRLTPTLFVLDLSIFYFFLYVSHVALQL